MTLPPRPDLLAEVDTTLAPDGSYAGPWTDSSNALTARLLYFFTNSPAPQVLIEESSDTVSSFGISQVANGAAFPLTARYFRLTATGGSPGAAFRAAIRRIT